MNSPDNLRRVAYEFAMDNYGEGVRYFEARYAPQLHAGRHPDLDMAQVIRSVNEVRASPLTCTPFAMLWPVLRRAQAVCGGYRASGKHGTSSTPGAPRTTPCLPTSTASSCVRSGSSCQR